MYFIEPMQSLTAMRLNNNTNLVILNIMKQLRHLFLIMALLITCTSAMSQESLSMWSGKTNDCPLRIGTLTKVSEDAYEGIATIGNDVYFAIKDGDTLYSPWWANVDDPGKMEPYYKFNSPGDSRFYFKKGGTFLILADKVINSNYDYSVAFTYQPPLCLNINGSNQQLLNTVCQFTG